MKYLSVTETAKRWNIAERSVRDYCSKGRVKGALLQGKTWSIPENAEKPSRQVRHTLHSASLLEVLKKEKEAKMHGGIYHKLQVEMTYNSNHMEGSRLSHNQTRFIFETRTIDAEKENLRVDDIIETVNHFQCIDFAIDSAKAKLSESILKQFHSILKNGASDSFQSWFRVGDYKMLENEVGGKETVPPEKVKSEIKNLLNWYSSLPSVTVHEIIEFHYRFEAIHPFQDGNGRVGRLVMLKECLKHDIVPILITDDIKAYYYRGLQEWENDPAYLIDTCLSGQDLFKTYLDYFRIKY